MLGQRGVISNRITRDSVKKSYCSKTVGILTPKMLNSLKIIFRFWLWHVKEWFQSRVSLQTDLNIIGSSRVLHKYKGFILGFALNPMQSGRRSGHRQQLSSLILINVVPQRRFPDNRSQRTYRYP